MDTYSGHMDTAEQAHRATATNIENKIKTQGITRTEVFLSAGMSRQSFERSMKGNRPFTITELIGISQALDTTPTHLLPNDWESPKQVAA